MLLRALRRIAAESASVRLPLVPLFTLMACGTPEAPPFAVADAGRTPTPTPESGPPPDHGPVVEPDAHPVVNVTMNANDPSGSGANTQETYLNVKSVTEATFGKLFTATVDGDQYAQPLYAGGLKITNGAATTTTNVVFAATSNDSVYAFNADTGAQIWKTSVGTPSPMPNPYVGNYVLASNSNQVATCQGTARFIRELGVTSTPVLDPATGTLYVLALDVDSTASAMIPGWTCIYADSTQANYCQTYTCNAPTFRYKLHALDVLTGAEKLGGPVVIEGSVPGTGSESDAGILSFDTMRQFARASLLLAKNGNIYLAFAGYSDIPPYHGWVFAYDAATLKQTGAFCDSPAGDSAGIWQSGRSLLSDGTYVYVVTGNGTFTAGMPSGQDYGDSVLKLNTDLTQVADYFSPYLSNFEGMNYLYDWDGDLGSAGSTLIPGTTLILATGKEGNGYLLDTANLGKWNPTSDKIVQKVRLAWQPSNPVCDAEVKVFSTPVAWTGPDATHVYIWAMQDNLREYTLDNNGQFSSQGLCFCPNWPPGTDGPPDPPCGVDHSQNQEPSTWGGGALSISSNGTASGTGLLWATYAPTGNPNNQIDPGVLEAYDATSVTKPIWSSATNAARDTSGSWAKFTPPTIANGKVYVPTFSNQLVVYGLLPTK